MTAGVACGEGAAAVGSLVGVGVEVATARGGNSAGVFVAGLGVVVGTGVAAGRGAGVGRGVGVGVGVAAGMGVGVGVDVGAGKARG